jgi:hypothetical protein
MIVSYLTEVDSRAVIVFPCLPTDIRTLGRKPTDFIFKIMLAGGPSLHALFFLARSKQWGTHSCDSFGSWATRLHGREQ